jgi:hypothetical protein
MRRKRDYSYFYSKKNKQTNKKEKKLICIQSLRFVHSLWVVWFDILTNSKKRKMKIIYICFILLSSLINSSTCGERVDDCTLSRSKQSINDNVISSLP